MKKLAFLFPLITLWFVANPSRTNAQSAPATPPELHNLKITILSTMLADDGNGEREGERSEPSKSWFFPDAQMFYPTHQTNLPFGLRATVRFARF